MSNSKCIEKSDKPHNSKSGQERLVIRDQLIRNSCDGCCAGHPIQNGMHINGEGRVYMMCQKHRYDLANKAV